MWLMPTFNKNYLGWYFFFIFTYFCFFFFSGKSNSFAQLDIMNVVKMFLFNRKKDITQAIAHIFIKGYLFFGNETIFNKKVNKKSLII